MTRDAIRRQLEALHAWGRDLLAAGMDPATVTDALLASVRDLITDMGAGRGDPGEPGPDPKEGNPSCHTST